MTKKTQHLGKCLRWRGRAACQSPNLIEYACATIMSTQRTLKDEAHQHDSQKRTPPLEQKVT